MKQGGLTIAVLLAGTAGVVHATQQPDLTATVQAYEDEARSLVGQPADPMHHPEVKAMRQLADALQAMPNASERTQAAVAKIREDADAIEHSTPTAVHSDFAKDALSSACDALESLRASSPAPDALEARIGAARANIAQINPNTPFLEQRDTIDSAFVRIGDALTVATQGGPAVSQAERQPVAGQEAPPPQAVAAAPRPARWIPTLNLSAGGGVVDFADDASRHLTEIGGTWDVRLLVGENMLVAGEAAYVGTANGVNNVMAQFASGGTILGTALEGDFRLQVPRGIYAAPVRPFGFWGLGWQHFDLVNENFRNPVAIRNSDDALVMPFGGGLQFDLGDHASLDTRFTYRAMFDEGMLHTNSSGVIGVSSQGLSQWTLNARLGYTF